MTNNIISFSKFDRLRNEAIELFKNEKHQEALNLIDQIQEPLLEDLVLKGQLLLKLEKFEEAQSVLQRTLSVSEMPAALYYLCLAIRASRGIFELKQSEKQQCVDLLIRASDIAGCPEIIFFRVGFIA